MGGPFGFDLSRLNPMNLFRSQSLGSVPQTNGGKKNLADAMRLSSSMLKGAGSPPKSSFVDIGGGYIMRKDPSFGEQLSALFGPLAESQLGEQQRQRERAEKNEDLDKAVERAIGQAVGTEKGISPIRVGEHKATMEIDEDFSKRAEQRKFEIDKELRMVDSDIAKARAEGDSERARELEDYKAKLQEDKIQLEADIANEQAKQKHEFELENLGIGGESAARVAQIGADSRERVADTRAEAAARKAAADAAAKAGVSSMKLNDSGKAKLGARKQLAEQLVANRLKKKEGFLEGILSDQKVQDITSAWTSALTEHRAENGEPVFAFSIESIPWDDIEQIKQRLQEFASESSGPPEKQAAPEVDSTNKYKIRQGKTAPSGRALPSYQ